MIKSITKGAVAALIAVTLLLPFNTLKAGIPVGTWRSHPAYSDPTFSVKAFGYIFILSEGSLFLYDPDDTGIYIMDKNGGLGDTDISLMGYCNSEKALILVYSNGNIDILYDDFTIYNFTDLKNNNTGSVSVNELKIIDNYAYIATNIGLVIFDIGRREIRSTYRFDAPVNTSVLMGDSLFCSTKNGVYLGLITDNLLDNTYWKTFRTINFLDLYVFDGILSGRSYDNRCWTFDHSTGNITNVRDNVDGISYLDDGRLVLIQDSVFTIYNSYSDYTQFDFTSHINSVMADDEKLWVCQDDLGLIQISITDEGLVTHNMGISPNSPRRNTFHSVCWPEPGKMLAVSGCHNYSGIDYPGSVMIFQNDRWSYLEENLSKKTGLKYVNLTEAAQDPKNPYHIYVGSAGQGLYEFKYGSFEKLHTWNNSALSSILNDTEKHRYNYVRVSALQFDKDGNLWMANNETDTVIKVLQPDGNWFSLYYNEIAGLPTLKQLKFDKKGKIWLNSSRNEPGLICIDLNGTIKYNNDDIIKFSGPNFVNQDGNTEEISYLFFYEFDLNGDLWIGTDKGIFVLKNPDSFISNPNPVFERIKIPRNDGSGYADFLFSGVYTTAIYIDQGNRKWIGTLDEGIFLLSADGTQTLEHFTVSNSPLPSNEIISITENGQDGSLFFGTSLGMVEYGGQARDPEETLSDSKILVYPNPVKPDFDGYVTISGLTEWSTIRIMSNSGRLVHVGTSNGGSYSWNLTDLNGNQVPSGIYHAIITNQENSHSESTSITVIR